ncbi:hypothetical protein SAMN05444410_10313 [Hydrobacter penzbergensis]|uniref:Uncharacterized protein n=1 Tax=Hydrobacter penzbergensis TaxID=1235997 RepID=A0A8X8IEI7_9BACT|nr:hypothetical protein [Hydrobacter penzbergensis]SDW46033.1 hypothetical protein SAMN05444410_10313 [Hydrobacter penzbergensis]
MKTQQPAFTYTRSQKISNWGCRFDSLTELKYAISIIEDYEFLRERVVIYYDRSTLEPTEHLRSNYTYYVPDFLIRHKMTGEAFLVEIKPRGFAGQRQMDIRKEVAERYIKWKGYDWRYIVVYDDEIILSEQQLQDFNECCRLKSKSAFKIWFDQYNRKLNIAMVSVFTNASPEARIRFIMFGHTLQAGGWRS